MLNEANFHNEVVKSSEPVLVDFWATWCGPCLHLTPIIDKLAEEFDGVKIFKINVDEAHSLSSKYGVTAIPALLFFKDGEVVDRMVGLQTEDVIRERLERIKIK
tara:strand:+ start:6852 stop:7163 length:312 start_codon:yes stop_codon:yes gene_type:complete